MVRSHLMRLIPFVLSDAAAGWSVGFHDNDPLDWIVTLGYLAAAGFCIYAWLQEKRSGPRGVIPRFWLVLAILMALLGINKQLNFQTLLGQIGREAVEDEGLYARRRTIQKLFIFSFCAVGAGVFAGLIWWVRRQWKRYIPALIGLALAGLYAVIRAATFHHVLRDVSGPRHHPLSQEALEISAVILTSLGASLAIRSSHRPKLQPFERTVSIR